jgi:hypothetical protein
MLGSTSAAVQYLIRTGALSLDPSVGASEECRAELRSAVPEGVAELLGCASENRQDLVAQTATKQQEAFETFHFRGPAAEASKHFEEAVCPQLPDYRAQERRLKGSAGFVTQNRFSSLCEDHEPLEEARPCVCV